ncbi:LOW QUALITY PROTEIN: protein FAM228A [Kogia breviceps]|uniref:LOW QUALITY PROTEIN: protein FAM228A n=1 Tax=Kogia breviceps TaxID=27615 RepID=UPI0034D26D27
MLSPHSVDVVLANSIGSRSRKQCTLKEFKELEKARQYARLPQLTFSFHRVFPKEQPKASARPVGSKTRSKCRWVLGKAVYTQGSDLTPPSPGWGGVQNKVDYSLSRTAPGPRRKDPPKAAITGYDTEWLINDRNIFLSAVEARKSKIKVPADSVSGSGRTGSVAMAHGPSCSAACGIFLDRGMNPCPLHQQADSQPLRHQGSPQSLFFINPEKLVCAEEKYLLDKEKTTGDLSQTLFERQFYSSKLGQESKKHEKKSLRETDASYVVSYNL